MKYRFFRLVLSVLAAITLMTGVSGCGRKREEILWKEEKGEEEGLENSEPQQVSGTETVLKTETVPETAPPQRTGEPVAVTPLKKTVYAVRGVNIRSGAGTDYKILDGAFAGDALEQTGVCDNGWIEISWRGVKAYVDGEYVTEEAPESEKETAMREFVVLSETAH